MAFPPPPPPRRYIVPPPALPTGEAGDAHKRRVTLNLIRHAACCPAPLRLVLDRLADCAWNVAALSRAENETIWGYVDDGLAEAASAEFVADTSSIIDHRGCNAVCRLCGQQHIRFEFLLRNVAAGGRELWTGSSCIEEWGLAVDGDGSAEDALARLRGAISKAKRKAEREDWQAAHPAHAAEMEEMRSLRVQILKPVRFDLYRYLGAGWNKRVAAVVKVVKAALKFYDEQDFLTESKTAAVYGPRGALAAARALAAERSGAADQERVVREWWQAFEIRHRATILTWQARSRVRELMGSGRTGEGDAIIAEVEGRLTGPVPRTPREDFDLPI